IAIWRLTPIASSRCATARLPETRRACVCRRPPDGEANSMADRFSWSTALKIARREARASRAKFLFVILAVAAGVGSLTGVRGFSASFRGMLLRDARTLMAADLTARMFALPPDDQMAAIRKLEARDGRWT